ncbi:MAG TPA: hypothetical protein VNJ08_08830 [Bacteriovoracaceae bacterium]|nr:hypothetical protein [Bacteriovoracaceae bacterium]
MTKTLEALVEMYRSENNFDTQTEYIGCGGAGLITFYKAIGVDEPLVDDLSANLIQAYVGHVRKNLHPAMAELCLLDFKCLLEFSFQRGATNSNYGNIVAPDTLRAVQNDFSAYDQKWKS